MAVSIDNSLQDNFKGSTYNTMLFRLSREDPNYHDKNCERNLSAGQFSI